MVDSSITFMGTPAERRDAGSASVRGKRALARRDVEGIHTVAHVHLDRTNVLRVRDGQATVVRALSGVVWITRERSIEDTVLLPGDVHRIENPGVTLVLANRASRVVLEVAEGDRSPRMLELAMRDGDTLAAQRSEQSQRHFRVAHGEPGVAIARA